MGKLSRVALIYIGAVVVTAVVLVARGPFTGLRWQYVVFLGILVIVSESRATQLRKGQITWSSSSAAMLASVVLVGPVGAAIVGACTALGLRRGPHLLQRVFNTSMYALSAYLAGRAFLAFGGHVGLPDEKSFPAIIAPFAAAALILVAANHGLLSGVLWLTRPPDRMSSGASGAGVGLSARLLLSDLGYAAYGLLMAALWSVVGFFAPLLVLIPLFVARWAVTQFAEQQKAYEATVGALCQAVETKDFYTRGHSDRVSRGSVMIAREIGMRGERVEAIRYAGMLHDVGKLGVPTKVLRKTGKLTEEEYAAIQLHPMRGLDIVREIGFLDEALAGIMHHHERIDGRGYPMGLAGDEIPEFARVLAVADAFDSMTSTRSYRGARPVSEAIEELRKWSGTQFDPAFVDAFVAALKREGWQLPEPPAGARGRRPGHRHRAGSRRPGRPHPGHRQPVDPITLSGPSARRRELRRYPWQVRDSGQLLLVVAAGVTLVAAVAQTAAEGLKDPRIAIAFGALIAFGEVLRLNLPGDRETAPIGFAGALAYALLIRVGTHFVQHSAEQVVTVATIGMIIGALPHLAVGRPARVSGMATRLLCVACVAYIFRPLAGNSAVEKHWGLAFTLMTSLTVLALLLEAVLTALLRVGRAAGQVPGGAGGRDARPAATGRGGGRLGAAHRVRGGSDGAVLAGRVHRAAARHPGGVPPVRRDPGHLPADRAGAGQGDRDRRVRRNRSFRTGQQARGRDRPGARHPRARAARARVRRADARHRPAVAARPDPRRGHRAGLPAGPAAHRRARRRRDPAGPGAWLGGRDRAPAERALPGHRSARPPAAPPLRPAR